MSSSCCGVHTHTRSLHHRYTSPEPLDSNQELFGIGFANMVAPFFGGFSVTGGFSRTRYSTPNASTIAPLSVCLTHTHTLNCWCYSPFAVSMETLAHARRCPLSSPPSCSSSPSSSSPLSSSASQACVYTSQPHKGHPLSSPLRPLTLHFHTVFACTGNSGCNHCGGCCQAVRLACRCTRLEGACVPCSLLCGVLW